MNATLPMLVVRDKLIETLEEVVRDAVSKDVYNEDFLTLGYAPHFTDRYNVNVTDIDEMTTSIVSQQLLIAKGLKCVKINGNTLIFDDDEGLHGLFDPLAEKLMIAFQICILDPLCTRSLSCMQPHTDVKYKLQLSNDGRFQWEVKYPQISELAKMFPQIYGEIFNNSSDVILNAVPQATLSVPPESKKELEIKPELIDYSLLNSPSQRNDSAESNSQQKDGESTLLSEIKQELTLSPESTPKDCPTSSGRKCIDMKVVSLKTCYSDVSDDENDTPPPLVIDESKAVNLSDDSDDEGIFKKSSKGKRKLCNTTKHIPPKKMKVENESHGFSVGGGSVNSFMDHIHELTEHQRKITEEHIDQNLSIIHGTFDKIFNYMQGLQKCVKKIPVEKQADGREYMCTPCFLHCPQHLKKIKGPMGRPKKVP
jgi:hypothetical protein